MGNTHAPHAAVAGCECPRCGDGLRLPERAWIGEVVFCSSCDQQLEVVSEAPMRVEPRAQVDPLDPPSSWS